MIEFLLGLVIALFNGTAMFSEIGAINSDTNAFDTRLIIEWPCLPDYDETCFMWIENNVIVETGP